MKSKSEQSLFYFDHFYDEGKEEVNLISQSVIKIKNKLRQAKIAIEMGNCRGF